MAHWGTIVIGGGTMGTSAGWALAKRGEKALVLEQFGHIHTMGSHSGQTRVFRHAYAEGPEYIPFVLRADDLWTELEAVTGTKVLHRVGTLELDTKIGNDHAQKARAAAEAAGIDFEWLNADEIRYRFPQFQVGDDWEAGFGARAGFLDVDKSLAAMASAARTGGVEIRDNSPVIDAGITENGVWVETPAGRETADRAIITAGAWSSDVLDKIGLPLTVLRKTLWWFEPADPAPFQPDRFPCFIADRPGVEFYGFPIFGQPGIKCANHQGGEPTTPDTVERTTRPGEEQECLTAAKWLFGEQAVTGNVAKSAVCLYTNTPDGHFVIDRYPRAPKNVVFAAGFSGHGYKFASAVGDHLVDLLFNAETKPYGIFRADRFA